jgi:transcriptional regulator with XRE-family HTH domain
MDGAGSMIREARRAAGLTQAQLARRMGITQPSVARIEAAGDNVTMATLKRATAAMERTVILQVTAPPDSGVDESQLLELLELSPVERLRAFTASHRNLERLKEKARG